MPNKAILAWAEMPLCSGGKRWHSIQVERDAIVIRWKEMAWYSGGKRWHSIQVYYITEMSERETTKQKNDGLMRSSSERAASR